MTHKTKEALLDLLPFIIAAIIGFIILAVLGSCGLPGQRADSRATVKNPLTVKAAAGAKVDAASRTRTDTSADVAGNTAKSTVKGNVEGGQVKVVDMGKQATYGLSPEDLKLARQRLLNQALVAVMAAFLGLSLFLFGLALPAFADKRAVLYTYLAAATCFCLAAVLAVTIASKFYGGK